MSALVVHHLNCASIGGIWMRGQHLVCHILLIETSADGLVLVDTGLGTADYADIASRLGSGFARVYARPRLDPTLAAVNQLKERGYDPSDVRHIVQTHLDLDHVGGMSDFPQATVHVHATELAAALRRKGVKARGRYRPRMWEHGPRWKTYEATGEPWFGFDAVRSLEGLPEGILFVPLFGHTHGHCGVAVETASGWLLDAGDAYFDDREVKRDTRECGPGPEVFQWFVTTEYGARRHNQDRLRFFAREHPEVDMFAAHNPHEYLALVAKSGEAPRGVYARHPQGATRVDRDPVTAP
jgi:glyoxylase-like metal-dependent hydrolase (beta-lactamase superfamily II)